MVSIRTQPTFSRKLKSLVENMLAWRSVKCRLSRRIAKINRHLRRAMYFSLLLNEAVTYSSHEFVEILTIFDTGSISHLHDNQIVIQICPEYGT